MKIFINGSFAEKEEAWLSPLSPGFMYGYGAFETIKVEGYRAVFLKEHYERLSGAMGTLNIESGWGYENFCGICERLICENSLENGFLKVICSKSSGEKADVIIFSGTKTYEGEYEKGFRLCRADSVRNEHSKLCRIKSMNYAENIIERERAKRLGFDEAVFLNTNGFVAEGCVSNIFWAREGKVFTPAVDCGILPGIARKKVIQLCNSLEIEVFEGEFRVEDVEKAQEVFVTNSLMDIMPVKSFESCEFCIGEGTIAGDLMEYYRKIWNPNGKSYRKK